MHVWAILIGEQEWVFHIIWMINETPPKGISERGVVSYNGSMIVKTV